jgi:hypothetical protein
MKVDLGLVERRVIAMKSRMKRQREKKARGFWRLDGDAFWRA